MPVLRAVPAFRGGMPDGKSASGALA